MLTINTGPNGWMRVNVGGSQVVSYLQRLFQLKYTGHLAAVTLCLIELLHKHSYRLPPRAGEVVQCRVLRAGGATHAAALLCHGSGRRGDCGGDAGETRPATAQAAGDKRLAQGRDAAAGPRASG
ncbi:uncharacterized protein isoform X2 [Salmo salar]|uniref:Uncharacterized protein isoform X2 n=1 Tax=Salmo salar TaxID=8030 RepID=A0A1S3LHP9_SALSA|nr:uncharacterized protein LOC106566696 isoform X2 [Salmo salar]|eukprot:XP_013990466.1 PREDICTED: uncharacterized protein LOC106566696 isoform X8 [Salmo salar]